MLSIAQGKGKGNEKKPVYKIIWVTPPDPVKIMTAFGQVYAEANGLKFLGVEKEEAKK